MIRSKLSTVPVGFCHSSFKIYYQAATVTKSCKMKGEKEADYINVNVITVN